MPRPKWTRHQNKPLTKEQILLSPEQLKKICRKYRPEILNVAEASAVQDAVVLHFVEVLGRRCNHFWQDTEECIDHKKVRECDRHFAQIVALLEGES